MKELGEKIEEKSKEAVVAGKELAAKAEVEINKGIEVAKELGKETANKTKEFYEKTAASIEGST